MKRSKNQKTDHYKQFSNPKTRIIVLILHREPKTLIYMNTNNNLKPLFMLTALMLAAPTLAKKNVAPNIVMIAVDDLKPILGCYGDPIVKTPNIDRLAERSTVFNQAYCQQSVSAATRASLLTGWCPDRTQVWDLKTMIRKKNPNVVTLPQYFAANGYETIGIGKIYDPRSVDKKQDAPSWSVPYIDSNRYLNKEYGLPALSHYQSPESKTLVEKYRKQALDSGYTKKNEIEQYIMKYFKPTTECASVPDNAYHDGATADGAIDFLHNYHSDKPFFLAVGMKKPHLPFCAPKKYWDLYDRTSMPLATYRKKALNSPKFAYHNCGELQLYTDIPPIISFSDIDNVIIPDDKARELIHGYYAAISYIDAQIGKLLDELERKHMLDNTIIVFWGDHGWHLGDHGLWNKHTNFEHATRVPMMISAPGQKKQRKIDTPVEFLSFYPTLCSMAGIPVLNGLDGENLKDVVAVGSEAQPKNEYAVSQYPRPGKMGYSIRSNRYRYTVWVDWKGRKLNADKVYAEELYDYKKDPDETVNVAKQAEYASVLAQMKQYWNNYKTKRIK